MNQYPIEYLEDVIINQGKLFNLVSEKYPNVNTEDFIITYMQSETRKAIDDGQAYVNTMDAAELLEYFLKKDNYSLKEGKPLLGFMPDWIGEFYALYQWYYKIPSSELIKKVSLEFLKKAYYGLHDLELDLAVKKVGENDENNILS